MTCQDKTYQQLEAAMLGYSEYRNIPVEPCGEPFVPILSQAEFRPLDNPDRPITNGMVE